MKQFTLLLVVFSLGLLFTGCPYDSPVGIIAYEDAEKINKDFIGNWTVFHEDGSFDEIRVSKGSKTVLHVQHDSYGDDGKKQEHYYYRAYSTEIKGVPVFNVEKKDGTYNFYKYEWKSDDEFVLYGINEDYTNENFEHADAPEKDQMLSFIESNIKNDSAYDDPLNFFREGSKAYKAAKN